MKKIAKLRRKLNNILFPATAKEKMQIFENFAVMLTSGIEVRQIFVALKTESKSPGVLKLLNSIIKDIDNGETIYLAFKKSKLLPKHLNPIIKLGEESGRLAENVEIILSYQKRDQEFKTKIRSASLYPVFVLVLLIIISLVVGLFILPNLAETYRNLNVDLPWITTAMINIGEFMDQNGVYVMPSSILFLLYFSYVLFIYQPTKHVGQAIIFSVPVIRKVVTEVELSRFSYLMASMLKAGMPLLDALGLVTIATPYKRYKRFYYFLSANIEQGFTFHQLFEAEKRSSKYFPLYLRELLVAAEQSGKLNEAFEQIANYYTKKSEDTTKDVSVMIEPVLLVIVWLGVAVVAFSIILPIYSITGNISNTDQYVNSSPGGSEGQNQQVGEVLGRIRVGESTAGYLNVTKTIEGQVMDQVGQGEEYEYLASEDDWYQIKLTDDTIGWINGSNIIVLQE